MIESFSALLSPNEFKMAVPLLLRVINKLI